jgi:Domain of unknown function (DUF4281)
LAAGFIISRSTCGLECKIVYGETSVDPQMQVLSRTHCSHCFQHRWMTNDANLAGFPQLLLIPCLFFTLMLGPTGLLSYFFLKNVLGYKLKEKNE